MGHHLRRATISGVETNNTVNNFFNQLYWFKRLQSHPKPELDHVIRNLAAEASAELGIEVPPIGWYEKADFVEALKAWDSSSKADLDVDPTVGSCEYFRAEGNDHSGYTPFRSATIMIATDQPETEVLKAVFDECFHIRQDKEHGQGWRKANYEPAEQQAQEFADSKLPRILTALQGYAAPS